ncbi:50S ribosomal protein L17 [Vampirovibrio chlorellavorus]|jgi:large subunit ribosomal protein L17|uniref:50S ribosomal protein L17 n=1 Tax=Vampirovibrio chlorellavorus TaxID=758823 RepID=UPI0026EFDBAF|nr:50S ribosomal protein L17 [Vampirovibrio chlorellavorus]
MRHRCKVDHLGRPADQRKALIRTLATSLFTHDEITTTLVRAKALKKHADRIVTLAKRGDVHAIRQVKNLIYHSRTGEMLTDEKNREVPETVLRRIFSKVGPRFENRKGGYTRVIQMPPRRGDAAPMALIQLTYELAE